MAKNEPSAPSAERNHSFDLRMFLNKWGVKAAIERFGKLFPSILEFSYSLVYVMPVLGLSALYINHRSNESDRFLVALTLGPWERRELLSTDWGPIKVAGLVTAFDGTVPAA